MSSRRDFLRKGGLGLAAIAVGSNAFAKKASEMSSNPSAATISYVSQRPEVSKRHFTSKAVEETIVRIKNQIKDPKLAWMFENCFPNTLDTTVKYRMINGRPDTYVITGDIDAMWMRDSSAQVWPYLPLCKEDEPLKLLVAGLVNRQMSYILKDPYANAFYEGDKKGEWASDHTDMKPGIHERKWEIDSLCYPIRLSWHYWQTTGDTSIFSENWEKAAKLIVKTFKEQQRKNGLGPYRFERETTRQLDTLSNDGLGTPVKPVGLIVSAFRPSDDATFYQFLIPSNLFAVTSLNQIAEISEKATRDSGFASECRTLAKEVNDAVKKYAITNHLNYGKVYAFEVDGFGNQLFTDDANVPSLLALPYLGCVDKKDPVYLNTRKFIWSKDNPYFFTGKAAEGIGGPHIGYDMIWPMSLILKAMTTDNDTEIKYCLKTLRDTDADTGFMHEAFHKDDPKKFSRKWFAWVNTLFGELIVKLEKEGKIGLLNNL
ncbi:MAG: glycoside hydrolase family 125 protein [Dysgonamonadaceae bacterium]|jgi:meiotically up-regulated gene 157 (Mug157) protein|nr:glycoside hydrolase family 125 protein [Dysgonamonadaceae bacterium]